MKDLCIEVLARALCWFYAADAKSLLNDDSVDERAIVGCIARYAWLIRQERKYLNLPQDVDIEYNKMHVNEDDPIDKVFVINEDCERNEHRCFEYCGKVIKARIEESQKKPIKCDVNGKKKWKCHFRPDLIIHKRGSSAGFDNGLVVEFKKEEGRDPQRYFV